MAAFSQGSWLSLFLGVQYVVCPTAYTLKNCIITPCVPPRLWPVWHLVL